MSRFLRPAYQSMKAYVPGEQPRIANLIKLNTNESPFPPAPEVIEAVNRSEVERLRLYSDPSLRGLREAIAVRHNLDVVQVTAGNGSDEILAFAFLAFGADGAVFPDITYGFYPVWARLFGMETTVVPLADDFTIDVSDYLADNRMPVIANPNAPTGIALPLEAIERIVRANPNHVVIVDEAYVEFGAQSAVELIAQYGNLLVARTFSKSHALAGARIGYAMGHPALIEDIERVRNSFHPYNVNRLSLLAGAAAMRADTYYVDCREKIINTRAYTAAALAELGFESLPSQANFLFARHPKINGGAYYRALRERGILVRHFDLPRIKDYNRITIGTMDDMRALISATREILEADEGR